MGLKIPEDWENWNFKGQTKLNTLYNNLQSYTNLACSQSKRHV